MPDPGDDDVIIIRHHHSSAMRVFLSSVAETAEDESIKASILQAVSEPPDIAPADTSTE